ncbi:coiled-coil and C2 domain-containing protein 1-like isoform X3 [Apostichopus japonicus]|uniref:coiled-coil and C2 domain-containing protein 1-like isoform X3 n=1 Tax=Stichopus japonicus TaxID=307972 RepID=UPI003AB1E494
MFGRKKQKDVLDENAQSKLAKQLGISLPGMEDLEETDDDDPDEMLEAELLALMEEEADSSPPPSGHSSRKQEMEIDEAEDDEDILAELAGIESLKGDSPSPEPPPPASKPGVVKREAPPSKEETHVAPPSRPPVAQPRSNVSQPLNIQPLEPTPAVSPAQTTVAGVHRPAPIHKPPAVPETRKQEDHQSTFVPAVTHQPQVVIPQGNAGVYPRPDYPGSDRIMASVPKQPIGPGGVTTIIESRIRNYETALSNARLNHQDTKARRYDRGLQTLKDLHKRAKAGRRVDESEVPPEVAVGISQEVERPPMDATTTEPQTTVPDENTYKMLCQRRDLYKMAALKSKREGDPAMAMEYLKVSKQFDHVIGAVQAGQQVDLSNMPPPPSEMKAAPPTGGPSNAQAPPPPQPSTDDPSSSAPSMPQPKTVLEALMQRRERYKTMADKATEENNSSKARRLGRIVKQYEDAIKMERAGRPVNYGELPELPDFPPLPTTKQSQSSTPAAAQPAAVPAARPSQPTAQKPAGPGGGRSQPVVSPSAAPTQPSPARKSVKESMNERQLKLLQEKQKKVRFLALQAKKQGDMEEAKRLIIIAKGFDPMIEAAENGLPVNMDSIPKLPDEEVSHAVSPPLDAAPIDAQILTGDTTEMYSRLISTLQKQIEQCQTLAQAYRELGNAQTANRFQEYCQNSQEDKDLLVMAHQHNDPVPRFHFEQRTIPTLRVTPGLKKEEAEITIIEGSNYKQQGGGSGEEIDTFVKFEFPYPSDKPQTGQTGVVRGAETVEYKHSSKVQVNLKARSFLSVVKRKQAKFEVLHRRGLGLLRGDRSLGTASLKLADLEAKQEISAVIPLCEGRKDTGGTLEVKICVHHPLSGIKEEFVKEKWLVFESKAGRSVTKSSPTKAAATKPSPSKAARPQNPQVPDTIDVLKFEILQLKKKCDQIKSQGKRVPPELSSTQMKMMDNLKGLQGMLQNNKTKQAYMIRLESNEKLLENLAIDAKQQGNKDKAILYLKKKQLVANEFERMGGRR